MKLFTGLTRIAHIPPYANVLDFSGKKGYWTDHSEGGKIFLDSKSNRILFPKMLHGKNPGDVSAQDFAAIPKEESGNSVYKLWLEDFNRQKMVDKLFDGFSFTDQGKILVDRLKKSIIKSKLDNLSNYGLDIKYSINPEVFDKLMSQTSLDRVKSMARSIGKKYRIATELIRESGKPKIANKIDNDFYFNWNKLEPLFDFDPSKYIPSKATQETDEQEEKSQETLQNIADAFLEETRNIMDPQMGEFQNAMGTFMKTVSKNNIPIAQKAYEAMISVLMMYIGRLGNHPVGYAAERIIQLPSLILLHHKLFEDSTP